MEQQTVVALLVDSMMMDGIAVSLTRYEAIRLIRLDPTAINLKDCLQTIVPDLIIFELGTVWFHAILSLLSEQPGLLLVGLDLECSRVIIMNSQQHQTKSIEELTQLFQDEGREYLTRKRMVPGVEQN
jgi:hypothetical protein